MWDSANQASIQNRETGATLKAIGSDPRRAHGLAPVLVLADEPAQWEPGKAEAMVAAMKTGLGKIPNGRFIALGTRPADDSHWFAQMLSGGACYAQVHAADKDDKPFQRKTWARSNPSLNFMPDLEKTIRHESVNAKRDTATLAAFRALRLNLGTSDVTRQMLIDLDVWRAAEGQADMDGRCYWGIDLGTSAAQSAVASYWPDTGRLEVLAAFPSEPSLAERGLADNVNDLYVKCFRRGELMLAGGAAVNVSTLLTEARDRFGAPAGLASDRWPRR